MKLQYASDLHLELRAKGAWDTLVSATQADVIALCGDVAMGTDGLAFANALSCSRARPVLYVLGNTEFHGGDLASHVDTCRIYAARLRQSTEGEVWLLDRDTEDIGIERGGLGDRLLA
jgi:predicted phosphodiesterase